MELKVATNTAAIDSMESRMNSIGKTLKRNAYDAEFTKQNVISRNLSIMGVPPTENEDLTSLAIKIFSLIGCELKRTDMFGCYRIMKGKPFTDIFIVKINDFAIKHKILKANASKEIRLKDVTGTTAENCNQTIFINNHVTPFFGKLLAEGRKAVKDKKIHSVWLGRNGCQLRFEAEGPERTYRSLDELIRLIAPHHNYSARHQSTKADDTDIPPKCMQKNNIPYVYTIRTSISKNYNQNIVVKKFESKSFVELRKNNKFCRNFLSIQGLYYCLFKY